MRKLILAAALTGLSFSAVAAETYTIDPDHTYPHFTISHLGFSTLHGRFNTTKGKIVLDKTGTTSAVDIVIDAASVDTGMKKRDDHLRSPDFLNAVEFPAITYKSSKVTFNGATKATVDGTLTISGVSKPVKLDVQSINCGIHPMDPKKEKFVCGFDATTKIKRSDFGLKYGIPAIGDEMAISLGVEGIRN